MLETQCTRSIQRMHIRALESKVSLYINLHRVLIINRCIPRRTLLHVIEVVQGSKTGKVVDGNRIVGLENVTYHDTS